MAYRYGEQFERLRAENEWKLTPAVAVPRAEEEHHIRTVLHTRIYFGAGVHRGIHRRIVRFALSCGSRLWGWWCGSWGAIARPLKSGLGFANLVVVQGLHTADSAHGSTVCVEVVGCTKKGRVVLQDSRRSICWHLVLAEQVVNSASTKEMKLKQRKQ